MARAYSTLEVRPSCRRRRPWWFRCSASRQIGSRPRSLSSSAKASITGKSATGSEKYGPRDRPARAGGMRDAELKILEQSFASRDGPQPVVRRSLHAYDPDENSHQGVTLLFRHDPDNGHPRIGEDPREYNVGSVAGTMSPGALSRTLSSLHRVTGRRVARSCIL
jgi:hypothetical protein